MRVKEESGRLILSDDMYGIAAICAAGSAVCAWQAIAQDEYTLLAGGALFLAGSLIAWQADRFDFDPRTRRMSWVRRRRWRKETGSLPFAAISGVRLEMRSRNRSGLWRIVFDTTTGPIPLLSSFSGSRSTWEPIASRIRAIVNLPDPKDPLERDLKGLLKAGRRVEAILMHGAVTRAKYADSKRTIDDLQERMAAGG